MMLIIHNRNTKKGWILLIGAGNGFLIMLWKFDGERYHDIRLRTLRLLVYCFPIPYCIFTSEIKIPQRNRCGTNSSGRYYI